MIRLNLRLCAGPIILSRDTWRMVSVFGELERTMFSRLLTPGVIDDELWNVASSEDDFLGLDHIDRTRSLRNGAGDLFLR